MQNVSNPDSPKPVNEVTTEDLHHAILQCSRAFGAALEMTLIRIGVPQEDRLNNVRLISDTAEAANTGAEIAFATGLTGIVQGMLASHMSGGKPLDYGKQ